VASAPWAIIAAMKHQLSAQRVVSASWQGQPVAVSCRMVCRYGWTSASIDVAVGDQVVLRTGGVAKLTGEHTEQFEVRGMRHVAGLKWGRAWWHAFPFALKIDDVAVIESRVRIGNWWLAWWPFYLTLGVGILWLIFR